MGKHPTTRTLTFCSVRLGPAPIVGLRMSLQSCASNTAKKRPPGSGPGGRWFKSIRPDHFPQQDTHVFWFFCYSAVDDFVDGQILKVNPRIANSHFFIGRLLPPDLTGLN